jgi:4-alpha-glucanotransferase
VADEWSIEHGYHDIRGEWRQVPDGTVRALRAAMGAPERPPRWDPDAVRIVRQGRTETVGPGEVVLEDGATLLVHGDLPPDLPLGYHRFESDHGASPLIVAPDRCHLPEGWRAWGFAAQLYALRSASSWGMGDLADLGRVVRWSAGLGARILLVNPLHAVAPLAHQQASPYSPSTRRFRNPLYLSVEDLPGAAAVGPVLEDAARAGRALNAGATVDRDAVWALKRPALRAVWEATRDRVGAEGLDGWVAANPASALWGAWCVLAARHGPDWRRWPGELRRPDGPGVVAVTRSHADEVRFQQWLQWRTEQQLTDATRALQVIQDLPIGVDPGGFDAWTWQDLLAAGVSVGSPPDAFSTDGQDWGLPPFVPHALRNAAYRPFVETIRATIAGAGGLRIDHVMGLFRLFWIPPAGGAADGAYVRYPADELLDLVCLESVRAGAVVVGEDLGTVEEGVRATMAERRLLSYKLLWFEPGHPTSWPVPAMAAVTTHDLPTVAGLWNGDDLREQQRLGRDRGGEEERAIRDRLIREAGVPDGAGDDDAVLGAHRLLGTAPCTVLCATLEDAVAESRRPNVPGTTIERPNWSIPLPVTVEGLSAHPLALAVAEVMDAAVTAPAEVAERRPPGTT